MMSEKVAFLTVEMELTPQEGQAFWPVYNAITRERDASMRETVKAFRALHEAVDNNSPEKEISKLLDAYSEAQENQDAIERMADEEFRKVLSVTKVAKLYIAEEKFRRQNIRKLRGEHGPHPQKGERPQR